MNFLYNTKDRQGIAHNGEIEAADLHSAIMVLRGKGLVLISVTPKTPSAGSAFARFFNRVSFNAIVTLTRQLATMVSAGLTLSESVDILYEQADSKRLKKALEEISDDIKGGLTLAQALSRQGDIFPPLYVNLVKSGEASGKLDEVLSKMADSLEK